MEQAMRNHLILQNIMEHLELPELKIVRQVNQQWEYLSRPSVEKKAKLVIDDARWPEMRKCVNYMKLNPGKIPISSVHIRRHSSYHEKDDLIMKVFTTCRVKELHFSNTGFLSNVSIANATLMNILFATASSLKALKFDCYPVSEFCRVYEPEEHGDDGNAENEDDDNDDEEEFSANRNEEELTIIDPEELENNINLKEKEELLNIINEPEEKEELTIDIDQPLCMSQLNSITLQFDTMDSPSLLSVRKFISYLINSARNIQTLKVTHSSVYFSISDILTTLLCNTRDIRKVTNISLICADNELINQLIGAASSGLRLKYLAINFSRLNTRVSRAMATFLETQKASLRTLRINPTIFHGSVNFPVLSNLIQLELVGSRGSSDFIATAGSIAPNISRLIIQEPPIKVMQVIRQKWGDLNDIILKTDCPNIIEVGTGILLPNTVGLK